MIELRKGAPEDKVMLSILEQWFRVAQPKWKKPLDTIVFVVFLCLTLFFFRLDPIPFYAWLSLAGVLLCLLISFFYIRLLAKMALASNKQSPVYYAEKHYCFYPDHFQYSYQGGATVEAPLSSFTSVAITKDAYIFMVGKKLALWIVRKDLTSDEAATLLGYLKDNNVALITNV